MKEIIDKIMKRIAEKREYYYLNDDVYDRIAVDALDFACDVIEEEVEKYNNGWIPCSERLPEEKECERPIWDAFTLAEVDVERYMASDLVNVTIKHWDSDEIFVCDDMTVNGEWVNFNGEDYEVIAWQPLPPAYSKTN